MLKKSPLHFQKSFSQIQNEWEKIQSLDIRNKHKAMRSLAHDISVSYKKDETSVEQLEFYIKALKQIIRTRSYPQPVAICLSKLIADWMLLTGKDKSEIILKKTGEIPVDTASIIIADPNYFDVNELKMDLSNNNFLNLLNQGKCYIFNTGADAMFSVQLRIIDAFHPVLTAKEFKCVINSSEIATIKIPTGTVAVADLGNLRDEKFRVSATISPGNYKICVYLFEIPKKDDEFIFYIVMCKTNDEPSNNLSYVHAIE